MSAAVVQRALIERAARLTLYVELLDAPNGDIIESEVYRPAN
jgi:hypothetical protein